MSPTAYSSPFIYLSSIKYLGKIISALDDDLLEVVSDIWKSQKNWSCLSRVLEWEGADA